MQNQDNDRNRGGGQRSDDKQNRQRDEGMENRRGGDQQQAEQNRGGGQAGRDNKDQDRNRQQEQQRGGQSDNRQNR